MNTSSSDGCTIPFPKDLHARIMAIPKLEFDMLVIGRAAWKALLLKLEQRDFAVGSLCDYVCGFPVRHTRPGSDVEVNPDIIAFYLGDTLKRLFIMHGKSIYEVPVMEMKAVPR